MDNYQFDEDFDYFLSKFGKPMHSKKIDEPVIAAYKDKLPEQLFTYWRGVGACGFANGLLWMTNPADYQDLLDDWLEGTPFEERKDLSVIARTAFGVLYVWARGKGNIMKIYPSISTINYFPKNDSNLFSTEEEDFDMRCFWGFQDVEFADYADSTDKPLFQRALKKLGPIAPDEMYGFAHSPVVGGKETLANLNIVKLPVYHHIARQLQAPQIVRIAT